MAGKQRSAIFERMDLHQWEDKRGIWQMTVCSYGGQNRIDIRKYFERDGELRPTKAGFVLTDPGILPFIDALVEAQKELGRRAAEIETGESRRRGRPGTGLTSKEAAG